MPSIYQQKRNFCGYHVACPLFFLSQFACVAFILSPSFSEHFFWLFGMAFDPQLRLLPQPQRPEVAVEYVAVSAGSAACGAVAISFACLSGAAACMKVLLAFIFFFFDFRIFFHSLCLSFVTCVGE